MTLVSKTRASMRGKTVVITGGTSGIGEVSAVALAKMGARIILVARDKARGDATLARLRDSAPGIAHNVYFADLLRLAEMKRVADQIAEQVSRIDVLINNAGALFATRRLTEDGLERTFALNHGLFPADPSIARPPDGACPAHRQYGVGRPSGGPTV